MPKIICHDSIGILAVFLPQAGAVLFTANDKYKFDDVVVFETDAEVAEAISMLPNRNAFKSELFTVEVKKEHIKEGKVGKNATIDVLTLIKHYPEVYEHTLYYLAGATPYSHTRH